MRTLAIALAIMLWAVPLEAQRSAPAPDPAARIPAFPTGYHSGSVTTAYDEFTRTTRVRLDGIDPGRGWNLVAFYLMPGKIPSRAVSVTLMLTIQGDGWQYLQCHDLHLLVDGSPLPMGDAQHDGSVHTGYVVEFITARVALSGLLRLAAAREVRGRLCNDEFALKLTDIRAFQDFASRMKADPTRDRFIAARDSIDAAVYAASGATPTDPRPNKFVASQSDKLRVFYLISCDAAKALPTADRVYFKNDIEARITGRVPSDKPGCAEK